MNELLEWMDYIEDTRQEKKARHKLKDIQVIVLFAALSNVDDWAEMEYWANYHRDYLRDYIELKNGIPSHDTLCGVFGMVSPDVIHQLYQKWQELANRNEGEALRKLICIDGKTMRSNKRKAGRWSHIVFAWSKGQLDVTFREDANKTLDKQEAQNLNIIRKWSLSLLKMVEIFRPKLSMRKKRFVTSMNPSEFLEQVLNF